MSSGRYVRTPYSLDQLTGALQCSSYILPSSDIHLNQSFTLYWQGAPSQLGHPSLILPITITRKQSGAGIQAGSGLTHQVTRLPTSPLPKHSSWTWCICSTAKSILLLSTTGSFGYVPKLPCSLSQSSASAAPSFQLMCLSSLFA